MTDRDPASGAGRWPLAAGLLGILALAPRAAAGLHLGADAAFAVRTGGYAAAVAACLALAAVRPRLGAVLLASVVFVDAACLAFTVQSGWRLDAAFLLQDVEVAARTAWISLSAVPPLLLATTALACAAALVAAARLRPPATAPRRRGALVGAALVLALLVALVPGRLRWEGAALAASFLPVTAAPPAAAQDEPALYAVELERRRARIERDGAGAAHLAPPGGRWPHVFVVLLESFFTPLPSHGELSPSRQIPVLWELGRRGLIFERFYANTMPSLRSLEVLLCSLFPDLSESTLTTHEETDFLCLPEILARLGYETVFFNSFEGFAFGDQGRLLRRAGFRRLFSDDVFLPGDPKSKWGYRDDVLYRRAFETLDALGTDAPLFVVLYPAAVHHTPFHFPEDVAIDPVYPVPIEPYQLMGNTHHVSDAMLRTFWSEVRERGLERDSLFLFVADHALPRELPRVRRGPDAYSYEEKHRVPLVVLWEGEIAPRRVAARASHVDVAPTVLDLLGVDLPTPFQGRSLLGPEEEEERCVPLVDPFRGTSFGIFRGDTKVTYNLTEGRLVAFDLLLDPREEEPREVAPGELDALGLADCYRRLLQTRAAVERNLLWREAFTEALLPRSEPEPRLPR